MRIDRVRRSDRSGHETGAAGPARRRVGVSGGASGGNRCSYGPRRTGATMRAAVWHGKRDVRVDVVPDPKIKAPTDAIVRVTSTGLCGSDLHLYEVLAPFMTEGDI